MKIRACVLVVCMTVVPALAMFSHQLPPDLRQAACRHLWQPVADWLRSAEAGTRAVGPTAAPPAAPAATSPASVAADRQTAADRLAALGGVGLDVRPLEGVPGMHVASCRVAMDAVGQLHRVFQAPGAGPEAATAALAEQIEAWRDRLAARVRAVDQAPGPL